MKISMLGCSGCGKSTYFAMMIRLLHDGAINGLTIDADDYEKLARMIEAIDTLSKGRFPEGNPTAAISCDSNEYNYDKFKFTLRKETEKILEFEFIDYAGGLIPQISKGENKKLNERLAQDLTTSDVVLIFVDSIILKECEADSVARDYLCVNAINQIIMMANERLSIANKKLNVIFAMTKCDASILDLRQVDKLKTKLKSVFSKLFSCNNFPIFTVESIGQGCVLTTAKWKNGELTVKNSISSLNLSYHPKNVVSILASAFLACADNLKEEVNSLNLEINRREDDFKGARKFVDKVFNKGRAHKMLSDIIAERDDKEMQYNNLKKHETLMQKIIKLKL